MLRHTEEKIRVFLLSVSAGLTDNKFRRKL